MTANVGLDIGTSAVRAALVETSKKGPPVLKKFAEVALPVGAIQNGEIVDETVLSDAVSRLFKEAKIPKKNVIVGIANPRVIVRQISVPYMQESEMVEALPFQAQEYIPIPIDEAILDFVPLEEFSTPDGEPRMSIMVVAAAKEMAADVVRILGNSGIKPKAIDLQAFALVRAATGGDIDLSPNPRAIVNIGASLTQVLVIKGGTLRFLRIVTMGGNDFTRVAGDALGIDDEQADQLKRRLGVSIEGIPTGDDPDGLVMAALTRQADALVDEVRSSLDFYLSSAGDGGIDTVLIAGNGARLPHLANRMRVQLNMQLQPVTLLNSGRLTVGKTGLSEEELNQTQPVLPVAVGLALWGEA